MNDLLETQAGTSTLLKWKIAHAKQVSSSAVYEGAKMDCSEGQHWHDFSQT